MAPTLQKFPSPSSPPKTKGNSAVSPCTKNSNRIYYILPEYGKLKPIEVTIKRGVE
jgi:hypothetical protein